MRYRHKTTLDQKAFTILELMIATTILAVILVLVTIMMIGIGNLYYKGVSQSNVQDNVRTVTDEISQDLQLNATGVQGSPNQNGDKYWLPRSYCIGTTRYTYILGKQITTDAPPIASDQSYHVLWRDSVTAGTCLDMPNTFITSSLAPSSNGTELIGPNSLLTYFTIDNSSSPFNITIGEAYGGDALLCDSGYSTGGVGDCSSNANSTHIYNTNPPTNPLLDQILCKGQSGNQLCATDYLTTTVSARL